MENRKRQGKRIYIWTLLNILLLKSFYCSKLVKDSAKENRQKVKLYSVITQKRYFNYVMLNGVSTVSVINWDIYCVAQKRYTHDFEISKKAATFLTNCNSSLSSVWHPIIISLFDRYVYWDWAEHVSCKMTLLVAVMWKMNFSKTGNIGNCG